MFREGTKEFEELMQTFKQQRDERDAEKKRNDPYQIQRHMRDGAEWVAFSDYVDKIERLKKIHEKELREARERGYSDGKDSNYSWRV